MRKQDSTTTSVPTNSPTSRNGAAPGATVLPHNRLAVATQVVLIVSAAVVFAHTARAVVLPILMAWVVSLTLKPLVGWLRACRVPTPLGAAFVVSVVVLVLALGLIRLGSPAVAWVKAAPENVPRLKEKFQHILRPAAQLSEAASSVGSLDSTEDPAGKAQPVEVKDNRIISWAGSLLAGVGETVALVFLLLVTGDGLLQRLVRAMPTLRDKEQALEISHAIQRQISRYLFSVGLVNICFGIAVALVLHVLGMPNATMWGSVAALLNFVPYFGPVVGMMAVGLAGLFAFDTLGRGMMPACAYLVLHLVEANAVTPFVLGRRFLLNPVIIFAALIFCIWLWGVTGALLAMPLLVTLKVVCERVPALATVAEFLSNQKAATRSPG